MSHPDALFVGAGIANPNSGVATVVRELSAALAERQTIVSVLSAERNAVPPIPGVEITAIAATGRLQTPFRVARIVAGSEAAVTAVHGFWSPPLVAGCAGAQFARIPLLLSPHGMFSPYSFAVKGGRKRLALTLGFRRVLRAVTAFHATCAEEAAEIRALGLRQPIHVVPNGVLIPPPSYPGFPEGPRTLLFMSRIHPKKGLPQLLRAFAPLAAHRPHWRLVVAGPDEDGHANEVAALANELGVTLTFPGPLSGPAKAQALAEADIFVLPTHHENFGIVVAEALAAGTPVLTTTGTPWEKLEQHGAGWWIPLETDALAATLATATSYSRETLAAMGARGRAWVERDFSWSSVARQYEDALVATRETACRSARSAGAL